jgi:hypothetical protein
MSTGSLPTSYNSCRQLRSETRTLAIRYNDINFRGYDMSSVSAFLESLPVYLRSAINRLNVSLKAGPDEPTVPLDVIQFCHDQPRSTVHFYHPLIFSSSATRLLFTAFMVKHGARRDTAFIHKLSNDPPMRHYLLMLLDSKIVETPVTPVAPKVFFHACDTTFDEAAFRESCRPRSIPRLLLIPMLANGIEDLIEVARDCVENGI